MNPKIKFFITLIFTLVVTMTTAQIDRSKIPASGKTPVIDLGTPHTYKLPNGVTLLVVENNKLPRVSISLSIHQPPAIQGDKSGVDELTSALLGKGSTAISKDAFNEEIDFLAATISLSSDGGYAASLSKYFPRVLELMADASINPNFTQEEFEKEKAKLLQAIKIGENSAESIAERVKGKLVYGKNHPYGEFSTEESINKITLDDVKAFYKERFVPTNAYIVVSGNIKAKEAKSLVTKYFKKWKAVKSTPQTLAVPADVEFTQINFVDLPNAVQSEIRLNNLVDLKMSDKDYFPVLIANYVLGGSFGSYINMNLREKNGFTYGAHTSVHTDVWTKGGFEGTTKVGNDVLDKAIIEILKEVQRIRTKDVSDELVEQAKASYLGNFIMATENPQTMARYAINIKTQNLPTDFYKNYIANINAVTKEDIKRVANKYFKNNNLRFTIVSKGSDVANKLEAITFNDKSIPVYYFDKLGNPTEKKQYSKEIPAGITAKNVLENYLKAVGNTQSVKTIAIEAKGEMQGIALDFIIKRSGNDKYLQITSGMGMVLSKQITNGNTVSVEAQGQKIPISDNDATIAKLESGVFPEVNLLNNNDIKLTAVESFNGSDAYVLALSDNKSVYYDVASGLKVGEKTIMEMAGQKMENMIIYGDYREVKGIKIPYIVTISSSGMVFDFKVADVKINEGVSDTDFK
ncbi:MAG: pitrilysin family protein [Capnocytophaga sp.]|nr:pitrilysin family protein [Capnocytophaga sp.]